MKNFRAIATAVLATLITLLSGCVTKPNFTTTASPANDRCLVYAYRAKDSFRDRFTGIYALMMDGKRIERFRPRTYLPISTQPGKHKFEYRIEGAYGMPGMSGALNGILDDHFLEVELEPGKTYYLSFGNPTFWLKLVNEKQALQDLQDCHIVN